MSKIKITETNGASAEDISAAIGEFLKQQNVAIAVILKKKTKKFVNFGIDRHSVLWYHESTVT